MRSFASWALGIEHFDLDICFLQLTTKCIKSYVNIKLETPVPVRSLKLGNLGHGYWLALGWVTIQV